MRPPPPRYAASLSDYVGDLRSRLFSSQQKAGDYFSVKRPTISRYESNTHKPPLGYVASLAKLFAERCDKDELENYRRCLLEDVNQLIRDYQDHLKDVPFADWNELCHTADTYLAKQRKPKQSAEGSTRKFKDQAEHAKPSSKVHFFTNLLLLFNSAARNELRNRQALLKLVRDAWVEGLLKRSLYKEVLIELELEDRQDLVDNPLWNMVLQAPDQPQRMLPKTTQIANIFEMLHYKLLILGEPGSGKTTLLLTLTRDMIQRAEIDPSQPIPVVFNLSSWSAQRHPIAEWLVEELNYRYRIPKKIGRPWIENDALLLLLDGLDEVRPEYQMACIKALNRFLQHHAMPIVICSRIADYKRLAIQLELQGAIKINPLNPQQIQDFFDTIGAELQAVNKLIQQDKALHELAQSPLMLNIITLAYHNRTTATQISATEKEASYNGLFDAYVQQMFTRRGRDDHWDTLFPQAQTTFWLSQLARRMIQQSQSSFRIDQIEPDWLPTKTARMIYVLASRLLASLIGGLIGGLAFGINFGLIYGQNIDFGIAMVAGILRGLVEGITGGLVGGLVVGIFDIQRLDWPVEKRSRPQVIDIACISFYVALSVGISFGLLFGVSNWFSLGFTFWLVQEGLLNVGLLLGLSLGVFFGIKAKDAGSISEDDIQTAEYLRWVYDQRALRGGIYGIIIGFLASLVIIFSDSQLPDLIRQATINQPSGILITISIISLSLGVVGVIFGGTGGSFPENIKEQGGDTEVGTRFWLNNGGKVGLQVGLSIGLVGVIIGSLISTQNPTYNIFDLIRLSIVGLFYGLFFGLLAALWYGGLDAIKHYTLRFLLYRLGYLPWRYQDFLDYCAKRTFLRKVGSSYNFIHRLLMDYFASLAVDNDDIAQG